MTAAIIVSGPCVHKMKPVLHAERIDYRNLLGVLVKKMGESCDGKPIITTRLPHSPGEKNGIRGDMLAAGFEVRTLGENERDSDYITKFIDSIDPTKTTSLALLTVHEDLFPVVCRLANKGLKIFWAATSSPLGFKRSDCNLSPTLTANMLEQRIEFVNLQQHRRQIVKVELQGEALSFHDAHPEQSEYTLSFRSRSPKQHVELGNALQRLVREFPGLTLKAIK